jgi:hypothetical protein
MRASCVIFRRRCPPPPLPSVNTHAAILPSPCRRSSDISIDGTKYLVDNCAICMSLTKTYHTRMVNCWVH